MTEEQSTEPLTPGTAKAEIASKQADAEWRKAFTDKYAEGHREAVSDWERLHEAAFPPPKAERGTTLLTRLPAEEGDPLTDPGAPVAGADPDTVLGKHDKDLNETERAEKQLRMAWRSEYDENVETAHEVIMELVGEHGMEQLPTAFGNDPEIVQLLHEIGEENKDYPIVAALREVMGRVELPIDAKAEIDRLKADPVFMKQWTAGSKMGRGRALALMRALHIAAHPPKMIAEMIGAKHDD